MNALTQDVRYAIRSLIRQPGFALTAIVTLALGIGAATAIFSVFHGVLLRPLPFQEPDRIVAVLNQNTETGARWTNASGPDFHDWRAQSRSFAALAYYTGGEMSVSRAGGAHYALAYAVTPGYFEALGARAAAGRLLSDADYQPAAPEAVVITDAYRRREFGEAAAVGATLRLAERTFTVVGVLPPGIAYPGRADIYAPSWIYEETTSRSGHNYRVIGRLAPDVSLGQAQAEMSAVAARLAERHPDSNRTKGIALVPLHEQLVGGSRQTLWILIGAVGLLLLVACANLANLLLARGISRGREMAVRAAVGAGRGRLIRQLLTESAVLGLAAALLGVWLARLGVLALVTMAPAVLPRADDIRVDLTALAFALGVAVTASVLFGLAPAVRVAHAGLTAGLREGGRGVPAGSVRLRSAFVVAQVALAVVLVMAAALLGRSLLALNAVDMGVDARRLLVLRTSVPVAGGADAPRAVAFYRDLLPELRALPGVEAVSAVRSLPTVPGSSGGYWIDGSVTQLDPAGAIPDPSGSALLNVTAPGYFDAIGSRIVRGRDFRESDTADAPMVAIVNESLAREAFPGVDPIGRLIQCGLDTLAPMRIVGIARDIRSEGPAADVRAEIFMPFEQHPRPSTGLTVVVRTTTADPLAPVESIRRRVQAANPDVPVRASTLEATLENAVAAPRFRTYLLIVFASVALLLSLAGVYGVMAYAVSQRVPELGVRLALGATPRGIMGLIIRDGAALALTGLALGIGLALLAGRLLEGLLFGVTARDPLTLAVVALGVSATALAAACGPGRRAARVDPMVALRTE